MLREWAKALVKAVTVLIMVSTGFQAPAAVVAVACATCVLCGCFVCSVSRPLDLLARLVDRDTLEPLRSIDGETLDAELFVNGEEASSHPQVTPLGDGSVSLLFYPTGGCPGFDLASADLVRFIILRDECPGEPIIIDHPIGEGALVVVEPPDVFELVDPILVPRCSCETDADCDDADACNGAETCVDGVCRAGTAVDCDDADVCTDDGCDAATGECSNPPMNCDDGDLCTDDACNAGVCVNTPIEGCCNTDEDCVEGENCVDNACIIV